VLRPQTYTAGWQVAILAMAVAVVTVVAIALMWARSPFAHQPDGRTGIVLGLVLVVCATSVVAIGATRQRELLASEERLRLLVDGTDDYGIFMLDPDGRIASWNVGAERIRRQ
jgi:PAS domain-containing protein